MKDIMKIFYELAIKAGEILTATCDCRRAEPYYVEVLSLIKKNPAYRPQFVEAFLLILKSRDKPWELIQFCMRELQWEEIKCAITIEKQKEIDGNHDWRVICVMDHILEVYEDEWDDSDLYLYYSHGEDG